MYIARRSICRTDSAHVATLYMHICSPSMIAAVLLSAPLFPLLSRWSSHYYYMYIVYIVYIRPKAACDHTFVRARPSRIIKLVVSMRFHHLTRPYIMGPIRAGRARLYRVYRAAGATNKARTMGCRNAQGREKGEGGRERTGLFHSRSQGRQVGVVARTRSPSPPTRRDTCK